VFSPNYQSLFPVVDLVAVPCSIHEGKDEGFGDEGVNDGSGQGKTAGLEVGQIEDSLAEIAIDIKEAIFGAFKVFNIDGKGFMSTSELRHDHQPLREAVR